jgi:hypothetical protein
MLMGARSPKHFNVPAQTIIYSRVNNKKYSKYSLFLTNNIDRLTYYQELETGTLATISIGAIEVSEVVTSKQKGYIRPL